MNRQEIKERAKEFAFNNKWNIWKPLVIICVITFLIGLLASGIMVNEESAAFDLISTLLEIALIPISIGYVSYVIRLVRGENVDVKEALLSKYKIFLLIFVTTFIVGLCTTMWTLLLIIPGIIYSYKVIMVNFILADTEENLKCREVISTSKKMMDGYKFDYFVFTLSLIGWVLLSIITCGIALIWALPYITVAQTMYYLELKKIYLTK